MDSFNYSSPVVTQIGFLLQEKFALYLYTFILPDAKKGSTRLAKETPSCQRSIPDIALFLNWRSSCKQETNKKTKLKINRLWCLNIAMLKTLFVCVCLQEKIDFHRKWPSGCLFIFKISIHHHSSSSCTRQLNWNVIERKETWWASVNFKPGKTCTDTERERDRESMEPKLLGLGGLLAHWPRILQHMGKWSFRCCGKYIGHGM